MKLARKIVEWAGLQKQGKIKNRQPLQKMMVRSLETLMIRIDNGPI